MVELFRMISIDTHQQPLIVTLQNLKNNFLSADERRPCWEGGLEGAAFLPRSETSSLVMSRHSRCSLQSAVI